MKFFIETKNKWVTFMAEAHFILVDLKGAVTKHLSFKYLAENRETGT